ncbi:MAG: tRNA pseudouridine(13) synthase TruD [Planctomycetes bacterium]|nr:tRNA pseudouridine(13) synthase TruD [Planctomycetota bacterium]
MNDIPASTVIHPPLLTADLPGLGGRIRTVPEDFEVEEIPAYQPCGSGDFLFLWIEKRDLGAEYFVRQVAKRLGIAAADIGTAGLKDRHAVTRQMISIPVHVEERLARLDGDGIRLLQIGKHTNKLRPGHLHGNRFRILIRDVADASARTAILERLEQHGLPNYYGPQRFGHDGETLHAGLAMLRGQKPAGGSDWRKPFLRKLALSAAQSGLFNRCLGQRLSDGLYRRVLTGDVLAKWPFGGMFVAEDAVREQERFDAREIVTAGPMFGRKMFAAAGAAAEREAIVLQEFDLTTASFSGFGKLLQGTRRHNVVYPTNLSAAMEENGLRLSFALPAGSYATVLLRELMKIRLDDEDADSTAALA